MCGLDVDLTKNKMGKIAVGGGAMKYQDGLARCIGNFVERMRPCKSISNLISIQSIYIIILNISIKIQVKLYH